MNTNLKYRILRVILIIELISLFICLFGTTFYHIQKLENKSQLFLDASRSDYLIDDSRSLQQKIQLAISSHEFKKIIFLKEKNSIQSTSIFNITLFKEILSNTHDSESIIGYAYFTFSIAPAIAEALLIWLFISAVVLLTVPFIQKIYANQIRVELETQQAKVLAKMATQVAHDIRSPLSTIRMILAVPDLNSTDAKELMNSAATRIDEIAQELVDTTKRNKLSNIELEPVNLSKLLTSLISEKCLEYKNDSSIIIKLNLPEDINILANKKELSRSLSNLINNSAEARLTNHIQIDIVVERSASDVRIHIIDNGTGMPQATIEQILQGSYQSTKSGTSGLGLGLKHANQVMQLMHGRLTIASKPDFGTTITLHFSNVL